MPEGDALHRAAAQLQVLVGERVEVESPHPRGAATGVAASLDGRVLERVEAVGKNLLLHFERGVVLRSHLRMGGRWRVVPRGAARVGKPWLVLRGAAWEARQWNGPVLTFDHGVAARVGPDILADVEIDVLVERLRRADQRRLVGDAVVDQRVLSGIGNMWMAESLWRARIAPWLALREARDEELRAALGWARRAMRASVVGRRQTRAVYRRAGRPCSRCGEAIKAHGLGDANRTAYWCPGCQRDA
jgi:endonuclease VIII